MYVRLFFRYYCKKRGPLKQFLHSDVFNFLITSGRLANVRKQEICPTVDHDATLSDFPRR